MTNEQAITEIKESLSYGCGDYIDIQALEIALSALEKQIPKWVTFHKSHYRCPLCNDLIIGGVFCEYCGQALDWSDTE